AARAALRRRGRAARAVPRRPAARGDGAREAHVLARAAARVDPVGVLDAARGPVRDAHRDRARRLRDVQGLPQPARELDLDRRRGLRLRHPARDVAAPAPLPGTPRMIRALGLAAAIAVLALAAAHAQEKEPPDVPPGDATLR